MDIEEIKKVAQEEMKKAITENLDSLIIFKYISNLEKELEKKDNLINEQLKENVKVQNELNEENNRCMILANNDKFKEQMIDLMAEELVKAHEWFYSEFDNFTKEDFIEYFTKKVEKGE